MDLKLIGLILSGLVTVCLVAFVTYTYLFKASRPADEAPGPMPYVPLQTTPQPTDIVTFPPDPLEEYNLISFAFEHKILGPGIRPDATTKMTRVNAAEDDFSLVKCGMTNGYAIKWMGRYLNVKSDGTLEWNVRKSEPDACWRIEPGLCGGDGSEFVMLRSFYNSRFLRVDGATKKLVCVDSPSTENGHQYCWRLKKTGEQRRRCGKYYDKDYGRVIDVPCEIIRDPPEGGSCLDVTPGFVSACCLKNNDARCRSVVAREVVGRTINEAGLYLKTRFPNHKVELCADGDACETASPFPIHDSNKWVVRYNKRLGTVTFPAYRFF